MKPRSPSQKRVACGLMIMIVLDSVVKTQGAVLRKGSFHRRKIQPQKIFTTYSPPAFVTKSVETENGIDESLFDVSHVGVNVTDSEEDQVRHYNVITTVSNDIFSEYGNDTATNVASLDKTTQTNPHTILAPSGRIPESSTDRSTPDVTPDKSTPDATPERTTPEFAPDRSTNYLDLTTQHFVKCFREDMEVTYAADSGRIFVDGSQFQNRTEYVSCKINLEIPEGRILKLRPELLDGMCNAARFYVWEIHLTSQREIFDACHFEFQDRWHPENVEVYSAPVRTVFFSLQPQDMLDADVAPFLLLVHFTTIPSSRPLLVVNFTTPFNGSVTTEGWGRSLATPLSMDTWVRLHIPADRAVMVSMASIDIPGQWTSCVKDYVELFEDASFQRRIGMYCGKTLGGPKVHNPDSKTLYVRFYKSWSQEAIMGFKLQFSLHFLASLLQQLPNATWNCSVPQWPEFQHHFPCNLRADCVGMEDEALCPYTSQRCGAGRVTVDGRCYIYSSAPPVDKALVFAFRYNRLVKHMTVTWDEADKHCRREGARLASLGSYQEMSQVRRLLHSTDSPNVFIGIIPVETSAPYIYKDMWKHLDGTVAHYTGIMTESSYPTPDCALMIEDQLSKALRNSPNTASVLCELPPPTPSQTLPTTPSLLSTDHQNTSLSQPSSIPQLQQHQQQQRQQQNLKRVDVGPIQQPTQSHPFSSSSLLSLIACPAGHVTHAFLAYDEHSACCPSPGSTSASASCEGLVTPLPPSFTCSNGVQHVPFTMVCDHHEDCTDRSDETFCVFSPCDVSRHFQCNNLACVALELVCDQVPHCRDASDEEQCGWLRKDRDNSQTLAPPAIIRFDGRGSTTASLLPSQNDSQQTTSYACPDTHFQCADDGYCMPMFVRCNRMYDCPGHEDEAHCEEYTCPGFYRCRASRVCVHPTELCDGVYHCPQRDDELLCNDVCPDNCTCYGLAYICSDIIPVWSYQQLRYLDASGTGLKYSSVSNNSLLIYLSLARCGVVDLSPLTLPNLHCLDLSGNSITSVTAQHLTHLTNLRHLILANNPLSSVFERQHDQSAHFSKLLTLDLTGVYMPHLDVSVFDIFPSLATLNLTNSGVIRIFGGGFRVLPNLREIDLRDSPMTIFPRELFQGLGTLSLVYADNYKLCCPATLPSRFNPANCNAPSDEISSCEALLRSDTYRVILSVFAVLAIVGNVVSLGVRVVVKKFNPRMGFDVFVTNLCISDLLMGVYLAIIGVADRRYLGSYLWSDVSWRHSVACKVAGFLSLLSSEVSAFVICLITLDRFLVLGFPFSKLHFKQRSALLTCLSAWLLGLAIAAVPLLPFTSHWEFYSQTGICIPLPITRKHFPGHYYAFSVMIVFNFVLFLLIVLGQIFVYWSVKVNAINTNHASNGLSGREVTVSRRLIAIAMTDFLCWFPIGVLGLLSAKGVPVASEVNVAIAILVLPLNSALNPFLYTFNSAVERLRHRREERMKKFLLARLLTITSMTSVLTNNDTRRREESMTQMTQWLGKGKMSRKTAASKVSLKDKDCRSHPEHHRFQDRSASPAIYLPDALSEQQNKPAIYLPDALSEQQNKPAIYLPDASSEQQNKPAIYLPDALSEQQNKPAIYMPDALSEQQNKPAIYLPDALSEQQNKPGKGKEDKVPRCQCSQKPRDPNSSLDRSKPLQRRSHSNRYSVGAYRRAHHLPGRNDNGHAGIVLPEVISEVSTDVVAEQSGQLTESGPARLPQESQTGCSGRYSVQRRSSL